MQETSMKRRRTIDETILNNNTCGVTTKPRTFFKLMLSPLSQSTKLRIPEKFAKAYHDELCKITNVTLEVPTGETWEVGLINEDNKLWFYKGWNKFVDKYSIEYGYFLVFIYDGDMKFNVHIFDLTTCEISYQSDKRSNSLDEKEVYHEDLGLEVEEDADDDNDYDDSDFECLGSSLSDSDDCSAAKVNSDDCSDAKVVELDGETDDDDDDYVGDDEEEEEEEEVKSRDVSSNHGTKVTKPVVATNGTSFTGLPDWFGPYTELLRAVTVAGIPIPKNSFFLVTIHIYSLHRGLYLNIPMPFARELLGCSSTNVSKFIKLEGADGTQLEVKCLKHGSKSIFGQGWIKFARHNGLQVGDICIFEVISSDNNLLKVQVVKKSKIKAAGFNF
ncbi:B3 domain-containing transcription factor VRN1-like [Silene latifolia]|uniref:B3 domain-containing transcription factor VRN1-like n=1 Tax=Silene latifolia TaxID=37657 RepID=UPI003D777E63